jgi:hypothetical protein
LGMSTAARFFGGKIAEQSRSNLLCKKNVKNILPHPLAKGCDAIVGFRPVQW